MDLATVMSVVQTILTSIQTLDQLREHFSFSNCKDKIEHLGNTINTVKAVLEDADAKQDALNSQQKIYIQELKDAIYDADDVMDEFLTLVKRKKLTADNHKLSNKVYSFLSRFSRTAMNLSSKVKRVNEKLDFIASNSTKFMFKIDNEVKRFTKEESCSFLSKNDIIGREKDVEKIVEILLNSNDVDQPNVLSVSIVGMGGLGKTALAQLIYNDPRVTSAFQSKYWICIGDQDDEQWSLSALLDKVVRELAQGTPRDLASLEQMQREVEHHLGGTKYLFVLDDVWTENYNRWVDFINFLKIGQNGSRILVTTRSKKTAKIVGGQVHELKGLSDYESWCLFERMAFRLEQRETPDDQLVKLGKEIVKKCRNVPLAIRVVGSLLLDELKYKWELFRDKGLANISENDTMNHILKLSYHQLGSLLKSCFTYCAIFPKDFEIEKNMLISLWMAQGYINTEYVGEEYFRILLQRCFFQDVTKSYLGKVMWFKIHDLLHDIAEKAAGKEICKFTSGPLTENKVVRHLGLLDRFYKGPFNKAHIRTLLQVGSNVDRFSLNQLPVANLTANLTCLRSLDLRDSDAVKLPDSIGGLVHLRYLDLSRWFRLEALPNSITKLVNLQTLVLCECFKLKELPKDIYKLVDLSTLDISMCFNIGHLPSNMGTLTKLHTLGKFFVGGAMSYENQCFDTLKDLHSWNNLKGFLEIFIEVHKKARYTKEEHGGGAYLNSKHLSTIRIEFKHREMEKREDIEWEQSLLEDMQPHVDIKELELKGYWGEAMPRWPSREDNSTLFYLPNLVCLDISFFPHLRFLPPLEKLPNLQQLRLRELPNVEYIVNVNVLEAGSLGEGSSFYAGLKLLEILGMHKLEGWWPGSEEQNEPVPCFANLKSLYIRDCPMLKSIPICSSLESVEIPSPSQQGVFIECLPGQNYVPSLSSDSKCRFITISDYEMLVNEEHDPKPTESTSGGFAKHS